MTFLYALVLGVVYWRTGRKDPLSKVFKSKGGGGGVDAALGGKGGGGGKSGGKNNKFKEIALKIWHNFRILILFAVIVLLLASPWFWKGSLGAFLGVPTLWALGLPAQVINVTGAAVATALLVIAVIVFLIDAVHDMEINSAAKNCLIAMPLLALISIGPVADWMQGMNATVRETATASVSWAWGA